jgi:phage FluMu gp28-like protein
MTEEGLLLPYQQRWVEDLARVKVCEKSRQIGITWATAGDAVIDAASQSGTDWYYTGYNKDQAAEFIVDVRWWVERLSQVPAIRQEMIDDEGRQMLVHTVRFNSGNRIIALPSMPRSLRGKRGVCVADEYAFHDDPAAILKSALAFTMWGGRVMVISTHDGTDSDFATLVDDIHAGKRDYSHHRITLDDAIGDGLYRKICEVEGFEWSREAEIGWREEILEDYGDAADEELFCIPSGSGGTYFSRRLIEDCMADAPVFRLGLSDDFAHRTEEDRRDHVEGWCRTHLSLPLRQLEGKAKGSAVGVDFGRTSDISALAPLVLEQNLSRRCPFLIELRNVPFRQQEQVLFYLIDHLPGFIAGKIDAGGNGQALAEAAALKYGDKIEGVHLSERKYGEMFPLLKSAFEDHRISIPRDADVLSDLRQVKVINGIPKLTKARTTSKADRKPRHGDSAVAFMLAYAASRTEVQTIRYDKVAPRGMWKRGAL